MAYRDKGSDLGEIIISWSEVMASSEIDWYLGEIDNNRSQVMATREIG